ncbi:MAG: tRNA uridine-5-carboxymethylaminomethyl(34) synthesis GTPase MnmE [Muribaculaceae bacterium]|nr:tRNA uridine-5-carboxymethylaminomethyl(34) synthesis GTPase MnmE [Muribaculaceae bacterium]
MEPQIDNMETIAAIATPAGTGGIAVIRLSGADALSIADSVWKGVTLSVAPTHTAHLGEIISADGSTLDQAVATIFAEGKSFTGEPTVEFSIHGATWLQREVLARLIEAGARMARPGEFSQRAVMNGRMDLAQAEGVADLIAASSRAAHRLATQQMKGVFSQRLNSLRQQMIDLASLLELELDFSEEDVEFADRTRLLEICRSAQAEIDSLASSFRTGKALKDGVAVVIAGIPNAGKSTLLNRLLEDEKAIVSDIPGTTRDIIEDTVEIDGILYRFIDTAGLREATDEIERIGIDRAQSRIRTADILLYLLDPTTDLSPQISDLNTLRYTLPPDIPVIPLLTKSDLIPVPNDAAPVSESDLTPVLNGITPVSESDLTPTEKLVKTQDTPLSPITTPLRISARTGEGLSALTARLKSIATAGHDPTRELLITNLRHYEALTAASVALARTRDAMLADLPADLIAQDLREAIHHLGLITGAITTNDLLQTIFSRFCIGK